MTLAVPLETQREIEVFLYGEARLLEQNRLDAWLDLLAEDICYRMPIRESLQPGTPVEAETFGIFDDDKASLKLRVLRIRTGQAHAEVPPSITSRLITNVMVTRGEAPNRFNVGSSFMVYQERRGLHGQTFFGHRDDVLVRSGESFLVVARTIELAQAVLPTTISIFF